MAYNLLIHSMREFAFITLPILKAIQAKTICEIGAEFGGNSQLLYDYLRPQNGKLISIDPSPQKTFLDWLKKVNSIVEHVPKLSLEAIPKLNAMDAWFIDGDHNWYTVYHELKAIQAINEQQQKPLVIFLHDVAWPWQHRDLYYAPETIPAEYRHPHSFELGVTLDSPELIQGGFRSHGHYAIALQAGGEKNGVLTAIQDFMSEQANQFKFGLIPGVFGLGILYDQNHPHADIISELIAPYHHHSLLQQLEKNRLANYLKVIEWQDRAEEIEKKQADEISNLQNIFIKNTALKWIEQLENEMNDPKVWKSFQFSCEEENHDALPMMIEYFEKLLLLPQDKKVEKLIRIVQAVCLAHHRKFREAKTILETLSLHHSQCSLVASALIFVNRLEDPANSKCNLDKKFCETPVE